MIANILQYMVASMGQAPVLRGTSHEALRQHRPWMHSEMKLEVDSVPELASVSSDRFSLSSSSMLSNLIYSALYLL